MSPDTKHILLHSHPPGAWQLWEHWAHVFLEQKWHVAANSQVEGILLQTWVVQPQRLVCFLVVLACLVHPLPVGAECMGLLLAPLLLHCTGALDLLNQ
jgi:hypothetical protein